MQPMSHKKHPEDSTESLPQAGASTEPTAKEVMQKARSELLLAHPFFGSLALKLRLQEDKKCQDVWTDGKTLGYNPLFISVLSPEQVVAVQAHEILHVACGHHLRRKGRDKNLWNKACDLAINGYLEDAGFRLPSSFKVDRKYQDVSVDAIYAELILAWNDEFHGGGQQANFTEEREEDADNASGAAQGKEGDTLEEQQSKASSPEQNPNNEPPNTEDKQEQEGQSTKPEDKDGQKKEQMQSEFSGEVLDHPLLSAQSAENEEQAERESKINLSQALQSAQHFGDIPLNLLRLFQQTLQPKLNWRILLQRFIESCNQGDYTWSVPNRRYISQDLYLPSRQEQRLMTVALAIDTSGSIDKDLLAHFTTELESILDAFDSELCVLYHDTLVKKHQLYTRDDRPLRLLPEGGGGTDYRPIPKYLEDNLIQPACLLWFTDLECASFPEEPPYPVLWISSKLPKQEPVFGEVLNLYEA